MDNILSPTEVILDCLHYATKIKPERHSNGLFPVGVTLRNSDIVSPKQITIGKPNTMTMAKLAPSKARIIKDFVSMDGYQTNLPVFSVKADAKAALMAQAWSTISPVNNVKIGGSSEHCQNVNVCISTVDHENGQLEWGRVSKHDTTKSIPCCDYGDECDALSVRGNQGPLGCYLTPPQQEEFDHTGELPEGPYFCLLCIRRDINAFQLAYSSVLNSHLQSGRGTFVIPPFKNIVNAPGGYHDSAMSVKEDVFMPIPVYICGVSGTLQTRYDPVRKIWFIDQGAIIYQGDIRQPSLSKNQKNEMDFH
jgi:hypothetical protein